MNEHAQLSDLLPLYISGGLDREQRLAVEKHLAGCAECQADLALWQTVAGAVVLEDQGVAAPRGLAERALERTGAAHRPEQRTAWLRRIWQLLRSQMPLVQREIWPASAAVNRRSAARTSTISASICFKVAESSSSAPAAG